MEVATKQDLIARTTEVLERRFRGARVDVGRIRKKDRVSGSIVWEGFENQEQIERQQAVHDALQQELGQDATDISMILAYTPHEIAVMSSV